MIFDYRKPPDERFNGLQALKDLYDFYLPPNEQATLDLIERYWKVVPYRLIRKYNELKEKGRGKCDPSMEWMIYRDNPFLSMIPKDSIHVRKYFPFPIVYYKGDQPEWLTPNS